MINQIINAIFVAASVVFAFFLGNLRQQHQNQLKEAENENKTYKKILDKKDSISKLNNEQLADSILRKRKK